MITLRRFLAAAALIAAVACTRTEIRPAAMVSSPPPPPPPSNGKLLVWQEPYMFGDKALLSGRTEPRATVTVNGRSVRVNRSGGFSAYILVAPDAPSEVEVQAHMPSGNVVSRRVTVSAR
jgi:hypothetical protein